MSHSFMGLYVRKYKSLMYYSQGVGTYIHLLHSGNTLHIKPDEYNCMRHYSVGWNNSGG